MKKLLRKKSVLTAAFITGAAILVFVLFGNVNPVTSAVKTVFSPILTVTSKISHSVGSFKDYLLEMKVYREENIRLNDELEKIKSENRDVSELTEENERLKSLLGLQSSLKFKTKAGLVISYEPNNWYDTLVINKGSNDGVQVGSAVISDKGIVGKVTETGLGWSRVASVLNDETAVGVRIVRTGGLAVLEGDAELLKEKLCKMSFIDENTDVMPGDILKTAGYVGIYPEDLTVGSVVSIKADSDGGEYAVVKPAADFLNLYEVLVVTEVVEE